MLYRTDEDALTRDIIALASEYARYGYRRITALLQARGWYVGKDRVQRIWRREGLKVPQRQKPRGSRKPAPLRREKPSPFHAAHVLESLPVQPVVYSEAYAAGKGILLREKGLVKKG
jgi:transposase InsO family protein